MLFRSDGGDLNPAALLRFRKFRKNRERGEKKGLAGDDLGLLRCWDLAWTEREVPWFSSWYQQGSRKRRETAPWLAIHGRDGCC